MLHTDLKREVLIRGGAAPDMDSRYSLSPYAPASKDYVDARNPYTYFTYSDLTLGTVNIDSLYSGGFLGRDAHHSGSNLYDHYYDSTDLYYKPRSVAPINYDSSANKVMAWNTTTHKMMPMYWPAPGTTSIALDATQTYTSGATLTIANGNNYVYVNPSSVQAALSITLPTTWHNSKNVYIVFGGTIASGNPVITSFSMVAGSGQTLVQT